MGIRAAWLLATAAGNGLGLARALEVAPAVVPVGGLFAIANIGLQLHLVKVFAAATRADDDETRVPGGIQVLCLLALLLGSFACGVEAFVVAYGIVMQPWQ